jgi:hypothetical protein
MKCDFRLTAKQVNASGAKPGLLVCECTTEVTYGRKSLRPAVFEAVMQESFGRLLIYSPFVETTANGGVMFGGIEGAGPVDDAMERFGSWYPLDEPHPFTGSLFFDDVSFIGIDGSTWEFDRTQGNGVWNKLPAPEVARTGFPPDWRVGEEMRALREHCAEVCNDDTPVAAPGA